MKGDFTRSTFDPSKHYNSVRMQQGRVQLDADWNEQRDITAHRIETEAVDLIGGCGGPIHHAGFHLVAAVTDLSAEEQARPENQNPPPLPPGDFYISGGRYYVGGLLCENDHIVPYGAQPDWPLGAPVVAAMADPPVPVPAPAGTYLAYLDVWRRHLTALEDPSIREVALGGPDTATRTKTVWQVKLHALEAGEVAGADCVSAIPSWEAAVAPVTGRLAARAETAPPSRDPCIVTPGAGFRRLENQLYRVEVHQGGPRNSATFKWSRDNGAYVAGWTAQNVGLDELTVTSLGRDEVSRFATGQWVELIDDTHELLGQPGTLARVTRAEGEVVTIDLATATGPVNRANFPQNPKVRRWDGLLTGVTNANWRDLEDGVQVRFFAGTYRTADYWQIPARTAPAEVEWPLDAATNQPARLLPHGIEHHYCRLALMVSDGAAWTSITDCRDLFPPVTELTALFYVSGDGQEAMPDPTQPAVRIPLAQPLQVGVANGQWPVAGATVRFEVVEGGGLVDGAASVDVLTGADGVASCTWEVDATTQIQEVQATLRDAADQPVHLPIRFSANLSVASEVAYDPGTCANLQGDLTVQDALDTLARLTSIAYLGGDGQDARPGQGLHHPLQVSVSNECGPVEGATVEFVAEGNGLVAETPAGLPAAGNTLSVVTGPDGVAACAWQLENDPAMPTQEMVATLNDAAGQPIRQPDHVRFTANLSIAGEVAYDPAEDCTLPATVTTVQEALDELCRRGGAEEPGIHVEGIFLFNGAPLQNDTQVPVADLADGIRVVCDADVMQASVQNKPVCFVTLYLPFPLNGADRELWGSDIIGARPLRLDAQVNSDDDEIFWQAADATQDWLVNRLFQTLNQFERGDRVLTYLTLKGNFIWADAPAADDQNLYLDGDVFGEIRPGDGGTDVILPSGDRRRGGDLEMWFYLVPSGNPDIGFAPGNLNFGIVTIGAFRDLNLNVLNTGDAVLNVSGMTTQLPQFSVVSPPNPVLSVPPGGQQPVVVRFTPNTVASVSDVLRINSNDRENPQVTVPLTGRGRFVVIGDQPGDIVVGGGGPGVNVVRGIGPVRADRLNAEGITTAAELAAMDTTRLVEVLEVTERQAAVIIADAQRRVAGG